MKILNIDDPSFAEYGEVLDLDASDFVSYLHDKSQMPKEGNIYVRDDEDMARLKGVNEIKEKVYGLSDIEVGYCNGFNSLLNCMEYHACPEVDIAGDDLVLILGNKDDIVDGIIDSSTLKTFYVKKGTAVILYPYTLHFSPCKVDANGFRCVIILSDKTNMDLPFASKDKKLWKVNKWLYAHKDSNQANLGAYIGIKGENIKIEYKDAL